MGDGRGGLYSYDLLDMLFGYQRARSADVVLPEYQDLAVGDVIPLGRGPDWPVVVVDHRRALVVEPAGAEVTWCWAIIPTDSRTRLVSRVRVRVGTRLLLWMLAPAIDLPWFMMERQMLRGIARRAEALAGSRAATTASRCPLLAPCGPPAGSGGGRPLAHRGSPSSDEAAPRRWCARTAQPG